MFLERRRNMFEKYIVYVQDPWKVNIVGEGFIPGNTVMEICSQEKRERNWSRSTKGQGRLSGYSEKLIVTLI